MDAIGVDVIEIEGDNLRQAKRRLETVDGVLSAAQIGTRLRVLLDRSVPDAEDHVRKSGDLGPGARVKRTRPNLEDVFVFTTREDA